MLSLTIKIITNPVKNVELSADGFLSKDCTSMDKRPFFFFDLVLLLLITGSDEIRSIYSIISSIVNSS